MKRVAALSVLFILLSFSIAYADETGPYQPGEILVKSGNGVLGWEKRAVPPGSENAEVARLRAQGHKAEVNGLWSVVETIPNDPRYPEQYGPSRIKAPEAWDISVGSAAVIISVIDTGVDCAHEDLSGKCVAGFDFVNNDSDAFDDQGHGTHVAGIATAVTNNSVGVAGVCWLCGIQPVKVLSQFGSGTWENVALGIVWAAELFGPRIMARM
jgi:thermitase